MRCLIALRPALLAGALLAAACSFSPARLNVDLPDAAGSVDSPPGDIDAAETDMIDAAEIETIDAANTDMIDAADIDAADIDVADTTDATVIDTPETPDAPPLAIDASPSPICDPGVDVLIACYAFETPPDPSVVLDGSQYANHASATGVSYADGVDGTAIQIGAASRVAAVSRTSLSPQTELTLEAWVHPNEVPGPNSPRRETIVHKQGQYGLFIYGGGRIECRTTAGTATGANVTAGVWTHVACVFSQTAITVFVGGVPTGTPGAVFGPLPATDSPLVIGGDSPCQLPTCTSPFDGLIDDLRVWKNARSNGQICSDAHVPGC